MKTTLRLLLGFCALGAASIVSAASADASSGAKAGTTGGASAGAANGGTTSGASADAKGGTTAAATNGKAISGNDREFVEKAARSGMEEVAISQAALPNLTNSQAKEFASMMVSDHTGANRELASIASRKGITPPAQQPDTSKWTKASGGNVDAEYMTKMVQDHEEAVRLFTDASKRNSDPELQAFATKTLPTLQAHLDKAKSIQQSVKK